MEKNTVIPISIIFKLDPDNFIVLISWRCHFDSENHYALKSDLSLPQIHLLI